MEEEDVKRLMAFYEFVVAGLERAGIFFTMLCWVCRVGVFYAFLLFSISSFLSFMAPTVQQLLYLYLQSQEHSDDENDEDEKETGQQKAAENAKDDKKELAEVAKYGEKLEILLEEILQNKNQVVKELEQEREKHKEERHAWEKEKTSLEDDVRVLKGKLVTFTESLQEKSLQWEEERSQLQAEFYAARASLQYYQQLMHPYDHYY